MTLSKEQFTSEEMRTPLLLQVTEVQFDFDDEDITAEQQQEVVDSVVGNTFEVEVDDANDAGEVGDVLVECLTDLTNWCVVSLNYHEVTDNYPELIGNVPLEGLSTGSPKPPDCVPYLKHEKHPPATPRRFHSDR
jgi:hypothetical protein